MAEYTLTYSKGVQGWPSFYSFIPEWIQGTNNYLYTFNGGNIWRHNSNNDRANFYGTQHASSVRTVINESSLETKVFKSINLVGTPGVGWGTSIISNMEFDAHTTNFNATGDGEWTSAKEGHMFSYIYDAPLVANVNVTLLQTLIGEAVNQRSVGSVGTFVATDVESLGGTLYRINFPLGFVINPIVSVGDNTITQSAVGGTLGLAFNTGFITDIGVNTAYSLTPPVPPDSPFVGQPMVEIDINTAIVPPTFFTDSLLLFVKDQQVESYGLLGDYADITLSINTSNAVELFSIGSEVMKSNP